MCNWAHTGVIGRTNSCVKLLTHQQNLVFQSCYVTGCLKESRLMNNVNSMMWLNLRPLTAVTVITLYLHAYDAINATILQFTVVYSITVVASPFSSRKPFAWCEMHHANDPAPKGFHCNISGIWCNTGWFIWTRWPNLHRVDNVLPPPFTV